MKNEKLLKLVQKLQIDGDDLNAISSLSLQLSSQVSGGQNIKANYECNNPSCSTGANDLCTNYDCTGEIVNSGCTNFGCY